jgi:hypothetical protein
MVYFYHKAINVLEGIIMWSNEQLAYFAGIFDGEGHLSIELQRAEKTCRKKDYYTLRMIIANTNLEVIEWLVKHFGGSFQKCKKLEGCRQGYKVIFHGCKLFEPLLACYPYLIIKRPIADVAIEFRKTVGKTGWKVSEETLAQRQKLYLAAKIINKKGDHS